MRKQCLAIGLLLLLSSCKDIHDGMSITSVTGGEGQIDIEATYEGDASKAFDKEYPKSYINAFMAPCDHNTKSMDARAIDYTLERKNKILYIRSKFSCSQKYTFIENNVVQGGSPIDWATACYFVKLSPASGMKFSARSSEGATAPAANICRR